MRRLGSLAAALALTVLMVGSVAAAPRSTFIGDFDTTVDGQVVGHVTAALWSNTAFSGPVGTYSSSVPGWGISHAQVGTTWFFRHPESGLDEVWFKALEIGYPGGGADPGFGMFVGHFVNMLDPKATDYVEFWGQPILSEPTPWAGYASFGDPYYFRFDVGKGVFALHVAR